jgi:hypothetical protein
MHHHIGSFKAAYPKLCFFFSPQGLDATMGFTSKEVKGRLIGDADLRRQARLSHSLLGMCAPVALETNGKD